MAAPEYYVYGILPDLFLTEPWDLSVIALVPDSDERVQAISKRDQVLRRMLNGFQDQSGNPCKVSVLIIRKDAPETVRDMTAILSFRNLVALSCVLKGWESALGRLNVMFPLFSDYFDVYPFRPVGDGVHMHHTGAALNSWNSAKKFKGQKRPDLPSLGRALRAEADNTLYKLLTAAWREHFEAGRQNHENVFRSLAVASHASSAPKKNEQWFYDYGVNIALWISAFETLVHPGEGKKANLSTVLDLLERTKFQSAKLQDKGIVQITRDKQRRVNVAGGLYDKLYKARCAFLHGDVFKPDSLKVQTSTKGIHVLQTAPILFKIALVNHLEYLGAKAIGTTEDVLSEVFGRRSLEGAMIYFLTGQRD